MPFERFKDRNHPPTREEILTAITSPLNDCWAALDAFLRDTYQVDSEPVFGPSYGWSYRYRKGGRPLCEVYPEHDSFTVQVVLGKKEAEQALAQADLLGPNVRSRLENTPAYHDGRWLFIQVQDPRDIEDIQRLVLIKRPAPKKR